ncbi:hypothetical protein pipiens_004585 [Culex pipiens pipiens]|uniref:Ig-like domain-containing protein n=1 Tax=Culex pipiens pipiens TaxID=38569 RepID=A0ABD1CHE5_CULPP
MPTRKRHYAGNTAGVKLTVRSSSGGRPTPTVNWWYDNEIVNHSSTVLSERRVKNTLILSRLERKHLKAVFTCTASNNNVTNPISASVTLDMNRKSPHTLSPSVT